MTPFQFREARKLYGQTQAQWAETLGLTGTHALNTISRYEGARRPIPPMVSKLVTFLVKERLANQQESLIGKL